jgi:hypothetical protein
MRYLGLFAALVLSGMTTSCAQRAGGPPVNIDLPSPVSPKATPSPRPDMLEERRRTAIIFEDDGKRLAARDRRAITERRPEVRAPKLQRSEVARESWRDLPSAAAVPSPPEAVEPSIRDVTLPPRELTVSTSPSALHPVGSAPESASVPPLVPDVPVEAAIPPPTEPPPPPEPAAPAVSDPEPMMPPPPEPAEPTFPTAALMPPPPEPAEPFLPDQEAAAAEIPVSIPLPELTDNLSLSPRSDWREVTATFSIPRSLLSGASETNPERGVASLIRDPWPLPIEP